MTQGRKPAGAPGSSGGQFAGRNGREVAGGLDAVSNADAAVHVAGFAHVMKQADDHILYRDLYLTVGRHFGGAAAIVFKEEDGNGTGVIVDRVVDVDGNKIPGDGYVQVAERISFLSSTNPHVRRSGGELNTIDLSNEPVEPRAALVLSLAQLPEKSRGVLAAALTEAGALSNV